MLEKLKLIIYEARCEGVGALLWGMFGRVIVEVRWGWVLGWIVCGARFIGRLSGAVVPPAGDNFASNYDVFTIYDVDALMFWVWRCSY